MACPTPIGFYYVYASSAGAGGAINYRYDGKYYDTITTSTSSSSQCTYPPGEPGNYLSCPAKNNGGSNMSMSGGSLTTSYTYEVDTYGNIRTIRSDSGSGNSSSNGSGGGRGGAGGKLGAALFCSDTTTTSTVTSNVNLKGSYKDIDSCGGKEYNIKSTGTSAGMQSTSGSGYQASCGNPNFSGADCSMNGVTIPINDNYPSGGPCSSTNGFADTEDVPACGGVVGGYHSGFNITETPTSTSGSYSTETDECNSQETYSQSVGNLSTVAMRKELASSAVDKKLQIADQNMPYQQCTPNTCPVVPGSFKKELACYGLTLSNPTVFGVNDSLSSAVSGYKIRAGSYASGKLSLGDKTQKVKMYIYEIPCQRDEYGDLYALDSIADVCNCGEKTPITETMPTREMNFSIEPKENITRTYSEDGKTITSEAIISSSSTTIKTNAFAVDKLIAACWVYSE